MSVNDCLMPVGEAGDFQLAADAVGAGDQDWMAVILGKEPAVVIEAEEAGKAAEAVEHPRRMRPLQERRHGREALLVQVEVEPGVAIGQLGHVKKSYEL